MFRLMLLRSARDNYKSLYQWYLEKDENGNEQIYEANSIEELSAKVKELLNTIPKDNIIIDHNVGFSLDALISDDDLCSHVSMTTEEFDSMYSTLKSNL